MRDSCPRCPPATYIVLHFARRLLLVLALLLFTDLLRELILQLPLALQLSPPVVVRGALVWRATEKAAVRRLACGQAKEGKARAGRFRTSVPVMEAIRLPCGAGCTGCAAPCTPPLLNAWPGAE